MLNFSFIVTSAASIFATGYHISYLVQDIPTGNLWDVVEGFGIVGLGAIIVRILYTRLQKKESEMRDLQIKMMALVEAEAENAKREAEDARKKAEDAQREAYELRIKMLSRRSSGGSGAPI